ncbi:MAG: hypothetical protein R3E31_27620 [Chloroflexota bacterium]|nr:hypothetical protein [Anaerolineales bacterium]MCA9977345.1 hypothetical protein [Anaerolineales bacterium]
MLDELRSSDFLPYVNDLFRVQLAEDETYDLELLEVKEVGPVYDEGERRRQFSLLFRHKRTDVYLGQAMYTVQHAQMGELSLFVVPLGPGADGMRYEVLFT